jgi:hypothetical protein
MTTERRHTFAIPRRNSPGLYWYLRALRNRGRGECRMRAAPAVSCANCARNAHTSIQVQRRQSDIPCAMVLRLMARSPRRRIRLVTVVDELAILSNPVGLAKTSADLTPATGARTTRFCRTQTPTPKISTASVPVRRSFSEGGFSAVRLARRLLAHEAQKSPPCDDDRARRCRVHRIPCPTFVTIANAPLRAGTAGVVALICPTG